jgi:hypothetical protein
MYFHWIVTRVYPIVYLALLHYTWRTPRFGGHHGTMAHNEQRMGTGYTTGSAHTLASRFASSAWSHIREICIARMYSSPGSATRTALGGKWIRVKEVNQWQLQQSGPRLK